MGPVLPSGAAAELDDDTFFRLYQEVPPPPPPAPAATHTAPGRHRAPRGGADGGELGGGDREDAPLHDQAPDGGPDCVRRPRRRPPSSALTHPAATTRICRPSRRAAAARRDEGGDALTAPQSIIEEEASPESRALCGCCAVCAPRAGSGRGRPPPGMPRSTATRPSQRRRRRRRRRCAAPRARRAAAALTARPPQLRATEMHHAIKLYDEGLARAPAPSQLRGGALADSRRRAPQAEKCSDDALNSVLLSNKVPPPSRGRRAPCPCCWHRRR